MSEAGIPPSYVVSSVADWKRLYQRAILELDPAKVPGRITLARHAMLDRAEEIMSGSSEGESRDLNYAIRMLKLLEEVTGEESRAA
jgi:hypothetical protein